MDQVDLTKDPSEMTEEELKEIVSVPARNPNKVTEHQDRFSLRIDSCWEHYGEDPVSSHVVASATYPTIHLEPHVRRQKVTEVTAPLNIGDIPREHIGYLQLINIEGTRHRGRPDSSQREDIKKRIAVFNGFEIHPYGMPFLGLPEADEPLTIYSRHGEIWIQTYVYLR